MEKPKPKSYYDYYDVMRYIYQYYNFDNNFHDELKEYLVGDEIENGYMLFVDLNVETYRNSNIKKIINCLKDSFKEEKSTLILRYSW